MIYHHATASVLSCHGTYLEGKLHQRRYYGPKAARQRFAKMTRVEKQPARRLSGENVHRRIQMYRDNEQGNGNLQCRSASLPPTLPCGIASVPISAPPPVI